MRKTWKVENFKMTVPYTYMVTFLPTNQKYYGGRFAEGCNPSEFWDTYKTSSKYVKQLVEEYGKDSFSFEIRKVFNDKISCRIWETKVLKRMKVIDREDFLNMTDNISISSEAAAKGRKGKFGMFKNSQKQIDAIKKANTGSKRSEEVKKKMSESQMGRDAWNKGIPHSEETKQKMATARIGRKQPKHYADKMRAALTGRKLYANKLGQKKFCFPGTEPAGFYKNN
jgi:hypothetical protein